MVFRRLAADLRVGARAEATGQFAPHVELHVGVTHEERLRVGVDRNEFDAAKADLNHAVHGVDAATADSDDLDDGEVVLWSCHVLFPLFDVLLSLRKLQPDQR